MALQVCHLFGPLHGRCCPVVAPLSETRLASLIIRLVSSRPRVRVLSVPCRLFLQPTALGLAPARESGLSLGPASP